MNEENRNQCTMDQTVMLLRNTHIRYISGICGMLDDLEKQFDPGVSKAGAGSYGKTMIKQLLSTIGADNQRTIPDFIDFLWEPLRSFGFQFSVSREEDGVRVKCTNCPWANMFRAMGQEKWGYALQCAADEELAAEFNPRIGFSRTRTLMEGDDHCDHFYFMKD